MSWTFYDFYLRTFFMGGLAMAIANCAITSLPSPSPNGSKFYEWFFNFMHALILAIPRIMKANGGYRLPPGWYKSTDGEYRNSGGENKP